MRYGIKHGKLKVKSDWKEIEIPKSVSGFHSAIYVLPDGKYVSYLSGSDVNNRTWEYTDTVDEAYDSLDDMCMVREDKPYFLKMRDPRDEIKHIGGTGDYNLAYIVARGRATCGDNQDSNYCETYNVPEYRRKRVEELSRSKLILDMVNREKEIFESNDHIYDQLDKAEREVFGNLDKLDMEDDQRLRYKWQEE